MQRLQEGATQTTANTAALNVPQYAREQLQFLYMYVTDLHKMCTESLGRLQLVSHRRGPPCPLGDPLRVKASM